MSKYGVFFGPYFLAFGPKKPPYLDTFHAVLTVTKLHCIWNKNLTYEKFKITSTYEVHKTMCHDGGYFLLFVKTKLTSFEIS